MNDPHAGVRGHKLLTKADEGNLMPLFSTEQLQAENVHYPVKLFGIYTDWRWYLSEYDGKSEAFGIVFNSMVPQGEFGYIPLDEMVNLVKGDLPLVERDLYWKADSTMADILKDQGLTP